jgi:glycosyltransferase involved in cell wall biosynthesis
MAKLFMNKFSQSHCAVKNNIKACMVAYTFYEGDGRVRRYAETLAKRGDHVDVIALRRKGQASYEMINGVNVYRIQERILNEKGKLSYLYRLVKFLINSSIFLLKRNLKNKYDIIHIHSVPDFEVFAALLPKLMGSKIILDIHDIVPEFYTSKFNVSKSSIVYKLLILIEKASISFSNHVIIANHIWEKTLISRSVNKNKCITIMNYSDSSLFHKKTVSQQSDKFIIIYPGSLNWHQGIDIAVKAFARIKDEIPDAEFHIYGEGPTESSLKELIAQLSLDKKIIIKPPLPIEEIAEVMANADMGVVPKRADSFGNEAYSTKIMEFMSLGVSVVVADTKIDKYYFSDSVVKFFHSGNEEDLAKSIIQLFKNQELRNSLIKNAGIYAEQNNWDVKKYLYLDLVDSLLNNKPLRR